jgi:hypothetical protein
MRDSVQRKTWKAWPPPEEKGGGESHCWPFGSPRKTQEDSGTLPNMLSGNWNTGEGPKPKSCHGGCEATDRDDSDESLGHVRLRGHAPSARARPR